MAIKHIQEQELLVAQIVREKGERFNTYLQGSHDNIVVEYHAPIRGVTEWVRNHPVPEDRGIPIWLDNPTGKSFPVASTHDSVDYLNGRLQRLTNTVSGS